MRRLKTGRRPPIYPKTPGHLPCSSLTHPLPLPSRRPSVSFGGFGLRLGASGFHFSARVTYGSIRPIVLEWVPSETPMKMVSRSSIAGRKGRRHRPARVTEYSRAKARSKSWTTRVHTSSMKWEKTSGECPIQPYSYQRCRGSPGGHRGRRPRSRRQAQERLRHPIGGGWGNLSVGQRETYSEMLIQRALSELLRDRTALIIAHRLSTIRNAGGIVVTNERRVAEEGSQADLMARGGLYKELQAYSSWDGRSSDRTAGRE